MQASPDAQRPGVRSKTETTGSLSLKIDLPARRLTYEQRTPPTCGCWPCREHRRHQRAQHIYAWSWESCVAMGIDPVTGESVAA